MRKTENFGGITFFNNNIKLDIKTIFASDLVRLTAMTTLMAIGLYLLQFFNFG